MRRSVGPSGRRSVTPSLRRVLGASYAKYSALFPSCRNYTASPSFSSCISGWQSVGSRIKRFFEQTNLLGSSPRRNSLYPTRNSKWLGVYEYVIVLFAVACDLCTAISSIWAALLHSRSEPLEIGTLVLGHSTRSFARTIRSLGCSALLTSLALLSAALTRSLTHSLLGSWDSGMYLSNFQSVLHHSVFSMCMCICVTVHLCPFCYCLSSESRRRFFVDFGHAFACVCARMCGNVCKGFIIPHHRGLVILQILAERPRARSRM